MLLRGSCSQPCSFRQGMAYAELAGLPPITGLYTSIVCLLSYAVFGPSRILVLGPDSALGPMIAATILPLIAAGGDESGRSRWHRCSRS
jgi:MFS superfamily sulfate permease-like transporter